MNADTTPPGPVQRYSPLLQLLMARLREFYREPEAVFWVYGFPIIMVVALGIAFRNQPVEKIRVDVEAGPGASAVVTALSVNDKFTVQVNDTEMARRRWRTGKTDVVVVPPAPGAQQYRLWSDPGRPESVMARNAVHDALQRAAGRTDKVEVQDDELTETGSRYIDFLVPGLLGMSLMGGGLWGVGFVLVDMRIRKLLKRFMATPMRKTDFLAAIMLSRLAFMVPEVLILLVFARVAFGVQNHGTVWAVLVVILLGATTFAGVGLLVASRAKTMEAVSGLMNLVMLPMWMLSGIFFSSERFPEAMQPFIRLLPLTPLNEALRAIMLEGASLAEQLPRLGLLLGWSVVSFALALRWFRWS